MSMSEYFLLLPIMVPAVGGASLWLFRMRDTTRNIVTELFVIANAVAAWMLAVCRPQGDLTLLSFSDTLHITLRLDGMGTFFLLLASTLWIFVSIYAFSYMKTEEHRHMFFTFFTLSLAAVDGIALAGNIITLYFFYEMLTLATLPLVMHGCRKVDMHAGRVYAAYQLGGAAFALVGIIYLTSAVGAGDFVLGGYIKTADTVVMAVWFVMLLGFGVKACIFPLYRWLPTASVAPTPVTALLHAAAVVKAGVFAVMRLSYYTFDPAILRGSRVGGAGFLLACFTAVFASILAVREGHFKRRMAYSTVSNLSYILVGVLTFTEAGLAAGLCHMIYHAMIKLNAFLTCGAFMKQSGKHNVDDLDGMGYRMPVTFACFTVSAISLCGIPPLNGFVSKWMLLTSVTEGGNVLSWVGGASLITASLLCAVYMLTCAVRAYFPYRGKDTEGSGTVNAVNAVKEAPLGMLLPMVIFAAANVVLGMFSSPITDIVTAIAGGKF